MGPRSVIVGRLGSQAVGVGRKGVLPRAIACCVSPLGNLRGLFE